MKTTDQTDMPRTRKCIETVAAKFNIYFLFAMAMCGAVMFIVGLISSRAEFVEELSEAGVAMTVGMVAFCLFFPWFTALYFARHLLASIKRLEAEVQELKNQANDSEHSKNTENFTDRIK